MCHVNHFSCHGFPYLCTASTVGRYVPISGRSLEFSPTSPTQYITVLINNDGTVRPDATFSVQLSSTLPRATLAPIKADVTILNDNSMLCVARIGVLSVMLLRIHHVMITMSCSVMLTSTCSVVSILHMYCSVHPSHVL